MTTHAPNEDAPDGVAPGEQAPAPADGAATAGDGPDVWAPLSRANPATVQLLGLCPLLAVSNSVVNGVALGLASAFVVTVSAALVATVKDHLAEETRLPALVLIIAGATTCAMLLMQAFAYGLYERIALFVQIIVTNCAILAQAEQVARRTTVRKATLHGAATGLGFGVVLVLLGTLRELIGQGTLLADFDRLAGPVARDWQITLAEDGFLLAALPPGAFLLAALLIAAHRRWLLPAPGPASTGKRPGPPQTIR